MGGWFAECDKFDKNGKHSLGIGKKVAVVSYYNKSQGTGAIFEYDCCQSCTNYYESFAGDSENDDTEDNVIVSIEYINKKDQHKNYYQNRIIIGE